MQGLVERDFLQAVCPFNIVTKGKNDDFTNRRQDAIAGYFYGLL